VDERSENSGELRGEISSPHAGRNGRDEAASSEVGISGAVQQILSSYPTLQKLRKLIDSDAVTASTTAVEMQGPVTIAQLEMLEAELQNQGILPVRGDRTKLLSQFANYEVDLWRWRARRVGSESIEMHFSVDAPRYLIHCALNLLKRYEQPRGDDNAVSEDVSSVMPGASGLIEINHSWITHVSSDANLPANLLYLERFATYLLGGYGRALNRFQRGLNVVLRALGSPTAPAPGTEAVMLTLPFSRPEFFRALKSIRPR
jgi:hypothetical protein